MKQKFVVVIFMFARSDKQLSAERSKQHRRTNGNGLRLFDYEGSVGEGNLSGFCRQMESRTRQSFIEK